MAEVEYVAGMIAETIEHRACFHSDRGRRRKQYRRVDIALERYFAAHAFARVTQIDRPVEADGIHADLGDLIEPQAATLREGDDRHFFAVVLALQLADHL